MKNKILINDEIFHGYLYNNIYFGYFFLGGLLLLSVFFLYDYGYWGVILSLFFFTLTNIASFILKGALRVMFLDVIAILNCVFVVFIALIFTYAETYNNFFLFSFFFVFYWAYDLIFSYKENGGLIEKNLEKTALKNGFDYMLKEELRRNTKVVKSKLLKIIVFFLIIFAFLGILFGKNLAFLSVIFVKGQDVDALNFGLVALLTPILCVLISFSNIIIIYFYKFKRSLYKISEL